MMGILIAGLVIVLAAAGGYLWYRQPAKGKTFHNVRCPACSQKIRYDVAKAGGSALCPRCKRRLMLPSLPDASGSPSSPSRPLYVGRRLVPK